LAFCVPFVCDFSTPLQIALFLALLGVSIWGITQLDRGLDFEDILSDSSCAKAYLLISKKYMEERYGYSLYFRGQTDFSSGAVQSLTIDVKSRLLKNRWTHCEYSVGFFQSLRKLADERSLP